MTKTNTSLTPAEEASELALKQVFSCLESGSSFLLEAGAGAGKTYTLVKALQRLMEVNHTTLSRCHQRIACITFTNVATEEIRARTDRNSLIHCDTIHAFCWENISSFQKQLRCELRGIEKWQSLLAEEKEEIGDRNIDYNFGFRTIEKNRILIHHDDVLSLTVCLMRNAMFRRILVNKYPVILIDEYQDTDRNWIESIKTHFLGKSNSPQFGFFGDYWQKIYGGGCGQVSHPSLTVIGKKANFRSDIEIVAAINRIRPDLPQAAHSKEKGNIRVFHSNHWSGERQTKSHWKGDLLPEAAHSALTKMRSILSSQGWNFSSDCTKILMLTHRILAAEQGYSSLPDIFKYTDKYIKKEHKHIAFFVDKLEPACEAFLNKQYGSMFTALGSKRPSLETQSDKTKWSQSMNQLIVLREAGTVGDVIKHLRRTLCPQVSESIERAERSLENLNEDEEENISNSLKELKQLHQVSYAEIVALTKYLNGYSPFQTKHGVKGAEFENVVVVVGRGWNMYNFNEMLEFSRDIEGIPTTKKKAFERNRNLFYVACSRPKKRLAVLFTQELSADALQTVKEWFGEESVESLEFS